MNNHLIAFVVLLLVARAAPAGREAGARPRKSLQRLSDPIAAIRRGVHTPTRS